MRWFVAVDERIKTQSHGYALFFAIPACLNCWGVSKLLWSIKRHVPRTNTPTSMISLKSKLSQALRFVWIFIGKRNFDRTVNHLDALVMNEKSTLPRAQTTRVPVQISRHIVLRLAHTWTDECSIKIPENNCLTLVFHSILVFCRARVKAHANKPIWREQIDFIFASWIRTRQACRLNGHPNHCR